MHNSSVPRRYEESKKEDALVHTSSFGHTLTSELWDAQHIRHETDRQYRQKILLSDDQPSGVRY